MNNKIDTTKEDIVNSNSVCIFADCSFAKYRKPIKLPNGSLRSIGDVAPAYCVYIGDYMVEQWYNIVGGLTSQEGEHYAVMLAIQAAYRYRNFPHIRIFSDSLTTIAAIRERNIKYIYIDDGTKFSPEQKYVVDPMYSVMDTGIPIEFYHVSGHVKSRSDESIAYAKRSFERQNPWVGNVDLPLIRYTVMGNCAVDEYSTAMLKSYIDSNRNNSLYNHYDNAIQYIYSPFEAKQMEEYKRLVFYSEERLLDDQYFGQPLDEYRKETQNRICTED